MPDPLPSRPEPEKLPAPHQEIAGQIRQTGQPPRPAWLELHRGRLERNLEVIREALPPGVRWLSVVKANAYGHGSVTIAQAAIAAGASFLGVATLQEGACLREAGIETPILLLGERHPDELPFCLEHRLRVSLGDANLARLLNRLALEARLVVPVHLKINTGMNRFGVPWPEALQTARAIQSLPGLVLEGVMSHFAMSDETDKTFALEQLSRFQESLRQLENGGLTPGVRHLCNTGGFLDLPQAHLDMVRLGILPLGVYPSATCRRLPTIQPVLSLKARFTTIRQLRAGDTYGYGLRHRATSAQRIGVLPLGYGDGYPRLRNQGHVLAGGSPAPLIGGVAMDAIGVDLTSLPHVGLWDEAVLLGEQGSQEISARALAEWGNTVCYDLLAGFGTRLPRLEVAA